MSRTSRTGTTRSTRTARSLGTARPFLTAVAIGAVAAIGLVVAAPGSGAFAVTDPHTPQARLGHSIETGHLMDDIKSGKITEADVLHAASTGIDVNGQHIDNWIDLSPQQTAAADAQVASLRASAEADPRMMASLASTEAAIHASLGEGTSAVPTDGGSILESKHWWNHLVHWYTIYINHAWLRGLISVAAAAAGVAICVFFDLSRVTCGIIGALFAGGFAEVLKSSASCSGKGLYISLPDTWNSHCEQ